MSFFISYIPRVHFILSSSCNFSYLRLYVCISRLSFALKERSIYVVNLTFYPRATKNDMKGNKEFKRMIPIILKILFIYFTFIYFERKVVSYHEKKMKGNLLLLINFLKLSAFKFTL